MPDQADDHVRTGLAHLRQQRWAEAEAAANAAIALRPTHADAIHLLGIVAWRTGRLDDAARLIGATVALAPGYAEAHKNLGIVLREQGKADLALVSFRRATALQPTMADAHLHLATLLREKGDMTGAVNVYRRVIALEPGNADAQNDLGAALKNAGRLTEAVECFRHALAVRPDFVLALVNIAGALLDLGEPQTAREFFRQARDLAPQRADARIGYCLSFIPITYQTDAEIASSRAAYTRELAALQAGYEQAPAHELAAAAPSMGQPLPFYLPYQGEDDRALQVAFGGLFARVMAAGYPQFAVRPDMPPVVAGEPIRVGVVSGFFRSHSVWKLFGGWVRNLDRTRFKLYGYLTGRYDLAETPLAKAAFDVFLDGSKSFEDLAAAIRADRLHVLLFPEIGMDQATARLAALPLAPVQAAAWGHPETSGLPTIDYFLSSDLMEPAAADPFYRERLVRLPNLSIHYTPLPVTPIEPALGDADVRTDAIKYLCCQSLYKYLPRNDDVFPRIAAAVPDAQFLFIRHASALHATDMTRQRLAAAFTTAGLDPTRHLVFLGPLDAQRYAGLNAACDVYLDSLEWSGGNTTLEAVAAGLPVVTLPGQLMRGRHSTAILQMMGVIETIARDKDDYVDLAVRLGHDPAWRRDIVAKIVACRARLYGDLSPVRALERLILEWTGAA